MITADNVMDHVLTLAEAAARLKMPAGSVRLGRGDAQDLTPVQFSDAPNAPLFYLVEEVESVLRKRVERIQEIQARKGGSQHAFAVPGR